MFTLREMCGYLEWVLNVKPENLRDFEAMAARRAEKIARGRLPEPVSLAGVHTDLALALQLDLARVVDVPNTAVHGPRQGAHQGRRARRPKPAFCVRRTQRMAILCSHIRSTRALCLPLTPSSTTAPTSISDDIRHGTQGQVARTQTVLYNAQSQLHPQQAYPPYNYAQAQMSYAMDPYRAPSVVSSFMASPFSHNPFLPPVLKPQSTQSSSSYQPVGLPYVPGPTAKKSGGARMGTKSMGRRRRMTEDFRPESIVPDDTTSEAETEGKRARDDGAETEFETETEMEEVWLRGGGGGDNELDNEFHPTYLVNPAKRKRQFEQKWEQGEYLRLNRAFLPFPRSHVTSRTNTASSSRTSRLAIQRAAAAFHPHTTHPMTGLSSLSPPSCAPPLHLSIDRYSARCVFVHFTFAIRPLTLYVSTTLRGMTRCFLQTRLRYLFCVPPVTRPCCFQQFWGPYCSLSAYLIQSRLANRAL
ncbi:hypothetical protein FRC09_002746 [Ceratobasidium sp. 395]|nr:hypothetical protein FRC09_002746 [Ceratobasidium sp. 395]